MDTPATKAGATSDGNTPEKYLRTFAGDMEILKKGGTPDLVPLVPAEEDKTPPSSILPPKPNLAQAVTPTPSLPKPPVSPLKTYSGDFSDRVKETHASTVTVLAAEQDSATRVFQPPPAESSHISLPYLLAGIALLIAGVAGIYVAYTQYVSAPTPVVVAPVAPAPIFVDEREEVSGIGPDLIRAIQTSVNKPLAVDTVRLLSVASSTTSVFSALAVSAPAVLLRNIKTSGSMAGVINTNGSQSPFFILSVASYSDTFAGMLSWESVMPLYLADLFPLYSAEPLPVAPLSTTTATTTKKTASSTAALQVIAPSAPVPAIRFFDTTIANHDARAYRDSFGRIVLVYGYWNATTLIIARDAATFTVLISRLATTRTL